MCLYFNNSYFYFKGLNYTFISQEFFITELFRNKHY